ncbi:cell wall metabolism sensor histidine kinase WalK [Terracoccus sp. 273MFTsu3.1]|uniref:sensor histidine kinase n=1 Tax=Terracoccus sp. 273MFTsu3.1 TaxID=1172188 RepID=UPI000381C158|nr:ATP-binding protein [Terracoccus sp. 273MFTsu3.1]
MTGGLPVVSRRSVGSQIRLLIGILVVLVPIGAIISVATIHSQGASVRALTLALGPAREANSAVLLDMTRAEGAWRERVVGAPAPLDPLSLRPRVEQELADIEAGTQHQELAAEDRARFAPLVAAQRTAVEGWFTAAEASLENAPSGPPTQAPTGPPPTTPAPGSTGTAPTTPEAQQRTRVETAYAVFQRANGTLEEAIRSQRDTARVESREATGITSGVIIAVAAVVVLVLIAAGFGMDRAVGLPLARLREVVRRQAEEDVIAMANQEEGALEVRMLARDFNDLTRANARLVDQQAAVLEMQELVLDVGRGARSAVDVHEALQRVTTKLGAGLGADRVLLYTLGDDGQTIEDRLQWHTDDLPDLPPLPRSLAQQVGAVNDELRRDVGFFDLGDLLAHQAYDDERARAFHRATGARSLLMLPVGTGGRGLGILSVMMVSAPRRWHRHEIQAAQQCAAIAAQSIVALRLSQMQDEQVRRLTELDRQKTDFMATVSHELRTPLTSISGYLELLVDGDFGDVSDGQHVALDIIGRNATRLRGLIEDLLVLNKIEISGLQAVSEEVPVRDLLRTVTETMEPVAAAGGVQLVCTDVPDDLVVRVDRGQVERALINLGSNAVKFTPEGGQVLLTAERSGDSTIISVHDTGIGIPASDLARLSERFFRAGNATAAAIPGTGLGLAIVRAIVEGHGGELVIASVEGEGTTMQVVLPVAQPAKVPARR